MRKRATVALIGVVLIASGVYGTYYLSPFGRHDRQAAAYERTLRARVRSVGKVKIGTGRHAVSGDRWGEGGGCSLLATLEVSTPAEMHDFPARLRAALRPYADEYLDQKVTHLHEQDGRAVFRIEAGTLTDGGSLDPRCG